MPPVGRAGRRGGGSPQDRGSVRGWGGRGGPVPPPVPALGPCGGSGEAAQCPVGEAPGGKHSLPTPSTLHPTIFTVPPTLSTLPPHTLYTPSPHSLHSLPRRLREVAQGAEGGGAACRGRGEETKECGQGACSREGVQGAGEGRLYCRTHTIQYSRVATCTYTLPPSCLCIHCSGRRCIKLMQPALQFVLQQ